MIEPLPPSHGDDAWLGICIGFTALFLIMLAGLIGAIADNRL